MVGSELVMELFSTGLDVKIAHINDGWYIFDTAQHTTYKIKCSRNQNIF